MFWPVSTKTSNLLSKPSDLLKPRSMRGFLLMPPETQHAAMARKRRREPA